MNQTLSTQKIHLKRGDATMRGIFCCTGHPISQNEPIILLHFISFILLNIYIYIYTIIAIYIFMKHNFNHDFEWTLQQNIPSYERLWRRGLESISPRVFQDGTRGSEGQMGSEGRQENEDFFST